MEPEVTYAEVTFSKDSDVTYAQLSFPPTTHQTKTGQEAVRTTVTTPGKTTAAQSAHKTTVKVLGILLCVLLITVIILFTLSVRWYGQLQRKTAEVTESAANTSLLMERLTNVSEQWEYTKWNFTQLSAEYREMSRQFGDLQQTNLTLQGLLTQQKQAAEKWQEMWQILQGRSQIQYFVETTGGNTAFLSWSCPQGWILQFQHCYYLSQDSEQWHVSRNKCESLQAQLLIVNSKEEQDFINSRMPAKYFSYWIGYSLSDGQWRWVDGSSPPLWFWLQGQPDNYRKLEHCATTQSTWTQLSWNDDNCGKNYNYICERDTDHMRINITGASVPQE